MRFLCIYPVMILDCVYVLAYAFHDETPGPPYFTQTHRTPKQIKAGMFFML